MRCAVRHVGHKTMDYKTAKFSMVSRSSSSPDSTHKDTFISSSRAEAMQDEAGYALAIFRRTVSSEKITMSVWPPAHRDTHTHARTHVHR